jgi:glycosyltransferase involved in cell wall biosynthesis
MKRNPIVTVLMAVYNGQKCIRPTIESILNQTFTDFEFLIVNDGSSDRTAEIIKSYKDPRITLFNNDMNLGQTKSLNVGLKLARGKYVARTDAGDVSLPERLLKQVKYVDSNPEVSVLGTSAFRYDGNSKIIDIVHMPTAPQAMLQRIFFASPVIHVSVLMNRKIILDFGGYDEDFPIFADYELWSKLLKNGYRIRNKKQILVGYMVSPDSLGYNNPFGGSYTEACKIIQSNVHRFANLSISFEEAANIYKLFTLSMNKISIEEIIKTECLFVKILKKINAPSKDINYFLMRTHASYVVKNIGKRKEKLKLKHSIASIFHKSSCIISPSRLRENFLRFCQSIIWRSKREPIKLKF